MVGFQTMVIMDLWGMFYHPAVVKARIFVLLLDLISAYCDLYSGLSNKCRPTRTLIFFISNAVKIEIVGNFEISIVVAYFFPKIWHSCCLFQNFHIVVAYFESLKK